MAVPLLRRIIAEHPIAQTRVEATEAASADPRKDALDEPGNASSKSRTAAELDQAAALLERVIFSDPDESVQREAIDALQHLPRARALVLLKKVVDTHSSRRIRREALETIEEIERKNEELGRPDLAVLTNSQRRDYCAIERCAPVDRRPRVHHSD